MTTVSAERADRRTADTHITGVSPLAAAGTETGDRVKADAQATGVSRLVPLLDAIRETGRAREDLMRAEQRLTLQIKAIERRLAAAGGHSMRDILLDTVPGAALVAEGDPTTCDARVPSVSLATLSTLHLREAAAVLHPRRLAYERQMEKLARQLPVWPWVESVRGFGALGLAQIIGECGDLWRYDGPAKVWKRMGVAVIDGERQRRVAGADALIHGYVPRRRAILFNIGESLIKGNQDGAYRPCYLARREYERERLGPDAAPILLHNRARRYMEKRLLRDLWRAWRAMVPRE